MSETYPLRAKAIGRSWALELVLGITGIGLKVLCRIPFYAARRPPREALSGAGIERCFFSERLKETQ